MKKFLILLALVALVSVTAQADTTSTYTNQLGQVVTKVVTTDGVTTTTITMPTSAASTTTNLPVAVLMDPRIWTNETLPDVTLQIPPAGLGEVAVWSVSNYLWLAVGRTTNDWVRYK